MSLTKERCKQIPDFSWKRLESEHDATGIYCTLPSLMWIKGTHDLEALKAIHDLVFPRIAKLLFTDPTMTKPAHYLRNKLAHIQHRIAYLEEKRDLNKRIKELENEP